MANGDTRELDRSDNNMSVSTVPNYKSTIRLPAHFNISWHSGVVWSPVVVEVDVPFVRGRECRISAAKN